MLKETKISLNNLFKDLKQKEDKEKAKFLARFFKTGPGQYGEGDLFLGITVPESRKIAHKYGKLSLADIYKLLKNKYHEVRLIALLILVFKFKHTQKESKKKKILDFYLKHTRYINNWDLVDLSAGYIVGNYLLDKKPKGKSTSFGADQNILIKLAKSKNLWKRRIAIISTFAFIYKGKSEWTFRIVQMLLNDPHDLIQKASGWMLREVGKRVRESDLTSFLDTYGPKMPRTMLRYAIERLPENKRLYYLNK